jgi:hypothetical protein
MKSGKNRVVCSLVVAGAVFTALAGSTAAQAASVTYSTSFSSVTDLANQAIGLTQFNPGLGTLQSATFMLDATMTTQIYAANDGNFYAGWDKLDYSLSLTGAAPFSDVSITASNAPIRIVGNGTPDSTFTFAEYQNVVGQGPMWIAAGPSLTAGNTFVKAAMGDFIGTGNLSFFLTTLNYDAFAIAGSQTGGNPPSSQGLSTNIVANLGVTYVYAPIPEPESYVLLLAGLGMVGAIARRRKLAT